MVLRVAFFVLMALGLMGFGTVAWVATRPPHPSVAANPPPPTKELVLVAAHPVHAGSLLKPEDLTAKLEPIKSIKDANRDTPETRRHLIGAMVRHPLTAGEIIRNDDVMRPGDHGFLAAVLRPGMRAVTIAVDNTTGSAGLIWPGDHVDLILTQTLSQPNVPAGRRVASDTILSDLQVLAIDQQIVQGAAPTASGSQGRTVTLEVTKTQAQQIAVAERLGRLSLAVRSVDGKRHLIALKSRNQTTWAMDVSPALAAEGADTAGIMRIYQGTQDAKEFHF